MAQEDSIRNAYVATFITEEQARTFAKEHGLSVVKCYVDYEYSGTNFNRPAFQEMMEDIKRGKIFLDDFEFEGGSACHWSAVVGGS